MTDQGTTGAAAREEAASFGLWLFLMSDAVLFTCLFATYAVMEPNVDGGPTGAGIFDLRRTAGSTALLLASAPTLGFALLAVQARRPVAALAWGGLTFGLGAAFLALTVGEFRSLVAMGSGPSRSGFLSAYFALVGAHGLHVAAGLAWMLLLTVRTLRRGIDAGTVARADRLAMFWHLVGIVWIGVYSVVYLPGLAW